MPRHGARPGAFSHIHIRTPDVRSPRNGGLAASLWLLRGRTLESAPAIGQGSLVNFAPMNLIGRAGGPCPMRAHPSFGIQGANLGGAGVPGGRLLPVRRARRDGLGCDGGAAVADHPWRHGAGTQAPERDGPGGVDGEPVRAMGLCIWVDGDSAGVEPPVRDHPDTPVPGTAPLRRRPPAG